MTIRLTPSSRTPASIWRIDLDRLARARARRSRFAATASMACFVTATADLDTGMNRR
ncbi:dna polymerase subunit gamma and tau [Paraburkholderia caribensis MBA4]|uniref:Dna polymerase subunit gamma and tau n=1 Tax=Paraburkholderia caribensis MBA4 TaxID=1323664 RepID=A0A0P0REF0_9BURK|nr:dna polymerase subunit gamma and tau [Paraburkholderia caribensis MBA4]